MEIQASEHVRDTSRGDMDPEQLHVQDPKLAEHASMTSTRDRRAFLKLAGIIAAATALEAAPVAAAPMDSPAAASVPTGTDLTGQKSVSNQSGDPAQDLLAQMDSNFAAKFATMHSNPWTSGILPLKEVEMIALVINIACTNLQAAGTRRHIRAALAAGATHKEILTLIEFGALLSIHSASLGAPYLIDAIGDVGAKLAARAEATPTPSCDKLKALGAWNTAWDGFFQADPVWTEQYFTAYFALSSPFPPRLNELLSIAVDASITHMYAPGTQRHVYGALKAGATPQEIMEVLKLCVSFGIESLRMGIPILAEEAPTG